VTTEDELMDLRMELEDLRSRCDLYKQIITILLRDGSAPAEAQLLWSESYYGDG
jgi:hypothetical protein